MSKNKLKSHRGACKRLWLSGSGKLRRRRAGMTHKAEVKSSRRKRRLGRPAQVDAADAKRIRRLIPFK